MSVVSYVGSTLVAGIVLLRRFLLEQKLKREYFGFWVIVLSIERSYLLIRSAEIKNKKTIVKSIP